MFAWICPTTDTPVASLSVRTSSIMIFATANLDSSSVTLVTRPGGRFPGFPPPFCSAACAAEGPDPDLSGLPSKRSYAM